MPRDDKPTTAIRWLEGFLAWWATWPARVHTVKMPNGTRTEVGVVARVAIMLSKLAQADGTLRGPRGGWLSERYLADRIGVSRPVLEQVMRWLSRGGWLGVPNRATSAERGVVSQRHLVIPSEWEMPQGWPHVKSGQSDEYESLASGEGKWPTKPGGVANETGGSGQPNEIEALAISRNPVFPEESCPSCGKGHLVERVNKTTGVVFIACSRYSRGKEGCKFTRSLQEDSSSKLLTGEGPDYHKPWIDPYPEGGS